MTIVSFPPYPLTSDEFHNSRDVAYRAPQYASRLSSRLSARRPCITGSLLYLLALCVSLLGRSNASAQDISSYYTVRHPQQFKTDWAGFYHDVDARTAAVRARVTNQRDLSYGPDVKQRLDLYMPLGRRGKKAPVFLFLHGGGFREGDRAQYGFIAGPLVENGIVVAVASYRLTDPGFIYPDQVDDVKLALRWLHRNIGQYGGDGMRIYVGGHSSGAMLAASVAADRDWLARTEMPKEALRGMVAVSALYDLRLKDPADAQKVFWSVYAPDIARQEQASPLLHVRDPAPNALIVAGSTEQQDPEDFVHGSGALAAALRAAGAHVQCLILEGETHKDTVLGLGDGATTESAAVIRMVTQDRSAPNDRVVRGEASSCKHTT